MLSQIHASSSASSASSPSTPPSLFSSSVPSLDSADLARLFDLDRLDFDGDLASSLHARFSAAATCLPSDSQPSLHSISKVYRHSSSRPVIKTPNIVAPSTPERTDHSNSDIAHISPTQRLVVLRRRTPPTRSLTYTLPACSSGDDNMATAVSVPSSPPDLSSSRSSTKSSSDPSSPFAGEELNDTSHFEDISLASDTPPARTPLKSTVRSTRSLVRPALTSSASSPHPNSSSPNPSDDLKPPVAQRRRPQNPRRNASPHSGWNRAGSRSPSAASSSMSPRLIPSPRMGSQVLRSPSGGMLPLQLRTSETSPVSPLRTQLTRRKSSRELEDEYHDSDEELPEDAIIWNVPLTPRPVDSRSQSNSPERNNTNARGSIAELKLKAPRSKSWTDALGDLSEEVKALTAALESHSDLSDVKGPSRGDAGPARLSLQNHRTKSMNLPLQRGHAMIDPLPVSKEKEKLLTRTRPSWLPPKCQKEERRHLKEWEQMMASSMAAEKRKAASMTKEKASLARRTSSAAQIWETEIIPNWNAAMRSPQTREMWWQGIPASVRGRVWTKAIGNDLHLSYSSYFAALKRASVSEAQIKRTHSKEELNNSQRAPSPVSESELDASKRVARMARSLKALEADIALAFPALGLFQSEQPLYRSLQNILKAYSAYRSDTGYIRGSSSVAALLLLNLSPQHADPSKTAEAHTSAQQVVIEDEAEAKAFIALANLLNKQPTLAFCLSDDATKDRFAAHVHSVLKVKAPRLAEHLGALGLGVDDWLSPMLQSCFTTLLGHAAAARLWDVLVFEGDAAAVRAAVGVLVLLEGSLYGDRREVAEALGWKGWVARKGEGLQLAKERSEHEDAEALIAAVRRAGRREPEREAVAGEQE